MNSTRMRMHFGAVSFTLKKADLLKMAEEREASVQLLKTFAPLDGLKRDNLAALAKKVSVRTMPAGRVLFKEGDTDKRTVWVVSGNVEMQEGSRTVAMIRGGTPEARNPLSTQIPRKQTARTMDEVSYLAIDSDLLDVMITWDQTGTYEVAELQTQLEGAGSDDWMTTLLQTKAFHRIPPANIQAIFLRMQRVPYKAGEVVIKQGDEGDYFYAIVSGKCIVTRETPLNKEGIKLAELGIGDTFGEEALIAEAKRNATVTMLSDGVLMRLNKQDFRELMNEPLLQWVSYEQARDIVAKGGKWLDVRLPSEHQNLCIEDSLNIPLYFIRLKISTLDRNVPYVVYCDTGRRSSAAAFILVERGFDAYVLTGGLTSGNVALRRSA
jgi:CRP-like cAMP-binding protein